MANIKKLIHIKNIWIFISILMATIVVTVTPDKWLVKVVTWCSTFVTLLSLLTINSLWDKLERLLEESKNFSNRSLERIVPFKKKVLIDAAPEDKEIAGKINGVLINNLINSALIKNIEDLKTNEYLQNAKVIITFYYNKVPSVWIKERLHFYSTTQVSGLLNQALILVCATQERQIEVEKYITNVKNKNLKIEVVVLSEKNYRNLLAIIRNKLKA
jgi:hypothetical protein